MIKSRSDRASLPKATQPPPYVSTGYRHDSDSEKGAQKARFTPNLPKAGMYRVSMTYSTNQNRATNVPVTIRSVDGDKKVMVNQQLKPTMDNLLFPLGIFRFEAGKVERCYRVNLTII